LPETKYPLFTGLSPAGLEFSPGARSRLTLVCLTPAEISNRVGRRQENSASLRALGLPGDPALLLLLI
jgi:hypothetical protein